MVKDIYLGVLDSGIEELFSWNGLLFFEADDGVHGNEVWKSDGTSAGTVMVRDIHEGAGCSNGYGYTSWRRNFTALVNDASGDKDRDGFTNLQEYKAGTDPGNPASKPKRAFPWMSIVLAD